MSKVIGIAKMVLIWGLIEFLLNYGISNLVQFVNPIPCMNEVSWLSKYSFTYQLILVLIIAPVFETFIFQFCIISIFLKFQSGFASFLGVFISAILFGWSHCYNINYGVITFILGLMFGYVFILGKRKYQAGLLVVALVHAMGNALAYLPI